MIIRLTWYIVSNEEQCWSEGNFTDVINEIGLTPPNMSTNHTIRGAKTRAGYVYNLSGLLRAIKEWGAILPVIGYNSGKFDLQVLAPFWAKHMLVEDIKPTEIESNVLDSLPADDKVDTARLCNCIESISNYKCVMTRDSIKFCDLIKFIPGRQSLDSSLKSYKLPVAKGISPYEILNQDWTELNNLELSWSSSAYDLFGNKLRSGLYRASSNLLEMEWEQHLRTLHMYKEQPLICFMARDILKSYGGEWSAISERDMIAYLGYSDVKFQKQRTWDLEDYTLCFDNLDPLKQA